MEITESAIDMLNQAATAEQGEKLDLLIEGLTQLNTYIGSIMVIAGIVISFVIVRFLWRFMIKPVLRDFIKLPL